MNYFYYFMNPFTNPFSPLTWINSQPTMSLESHEIEDEEEYDETDQEEDHEDSE